MKKSGGSNFNAQTTNNKHIPKNQHIFAMRLCHLVAYCKFSKYFVNWKRRKIKLLPIMRLKWETQTQMSNKTMVRNSPVGALSHDSFKIIKNMRRARVSNCVYNINTYTYIMKAHNQRRNFTYCDIHKWVWTLCVLCK